MLTAALRVARELRFLLGEAYARAVVDHVGEDVRLEFGIRLMRGAGIRLGSRVEILRDSTLDARSPESYALSIGDYCRIKENVWLACYGGRIDIGDHVLIGRNTVIHGHGGVAIGKWAMVGSNVVIVSASHVYWRDGEPMQTQGFAVEPVAIGENTWIGSNAVVLGGVHIGDNVVVGAGSVVTRNLESNKVYAGVPAVSIRSREEGLRAGLVLPDDPQFEMSHPVGADSRVGRIVRAVRGN